MKRQRSHARTSIIADSTSRFPALPPLGAPATCPGGGRWRLGGAAQGASGRLLGAGIWSSGGVLQTGNHRSRAGRVWWPREATTTVSGTAGRLRAPAHVPVQDAELPKADVPGSQSSTPARSLAGAQQVLLLPGSSQVGMAGDGRLVPGGGAAAGR